jgi:AcrR family transcriptional regulator
MATQYQVPPANVGLRERNKAEKLSSIKKAARELFTTRGFHATPMREVARVADVGLGTVSVYATDKIGLLAMLFVEDLEHFPPVFDGIGSSAPLIDQLMHAFGRMFSFWARYPELSSAVLYELQSPNSSLHVAAIMKRRAAVREEVSAWIAAQKSAKRVDQTVDADQAAETLFALYTSTVHEWLMANPIAIDAGLSRLRFLFELPVRAMIPTPRRGTAATK